MARAPLVQRGHAAAVWAAAAVLLSGCCGRGAGLEGDEGRVDDEATAGDLGALGEVFAELRELRREQADLRRRLDRCPCAKLGDDDALGGEDEGDDFDSRGVAPSSSSSASPSPNTVGATEEVGGLVKVDVQNTEWMKEVLFGGQPWVLHCADSRSPDPEDSQVPAVVAEAAQEFKSMANFGVVDCWQRMPTGKTLAHRFDFPRPPVTFAVANGDPPAVLDLQGAVKAWQVKRKAGPHLAASVERIDGQERFKQFCANRRACIVVGFKTALSLANALRTLTPLLETNRAVRAVAVDTTVWKVKLDERLATTKPKKDAAADVVSLLCLARRKGGSSRGGAFLRSAGGELEPAAVEEFLRRCADARSLVEFTRSPQISTRPAEVPKYRSPTSPAPTPAGGGASSSASSAPSPKKKGGSGASSAGASSASGASNAGSGRVGRKAPTKPSIRKTDSSTSSGNNRGGRRDDVGSRRQLEEEEEPAVVSVDEDEAEARERAAEEEEEEGWEEVEL